MCYLRPCVKIPKTDSPFKFTSNKFTSYRHTQVFNGPIGEQLSIKGYLKWLKSSFNLANP